MHRFRGVAGSVLAAGLLLLSACGGTPASGNTAAAGDVPVVAVAGNEFSFSPAVLTAKQGQPLRVRFTNTGAVLHDGSVVGMEADAIQATEPPPEAEGMFGGAPLPAIQVVAMPGAAGEVTFTPAQTGRFTILCNVPGHKEAGMMGMLTVTE